MSKKNKKKNKSTDRMTVWGKVKLFGTIVVIIWLSLAANGVQLTDGVVAEDFALASMLPSLPSFTVTKPGGVDTVPPVPKAHVVGVVGPIRSVPDGLNNYRGRGVTPAQLRTFLATSGTKKLMNLSGDIPGKITAGQARAVCAEFKVEYLTSGDLNRFAARSGYQEGRGFVRSAASAQRHLAGGNVLVIGRSGNRAGALIGFHLGAQGFTRERIIGHNNWEQLEEDPGKNIGYLETAVGNLEDHE